MGRDIEAQAFWALDNLTSFVILSVSVQDSPSTNVPTKSQLLAEGGVQGERS